jgi:acyl-CoA thioester hydrolase
VGDARFASQVWTMPITAQADDIDELGHVNNAVWVAWIQSVATAHWMAVAPADMIVSVVWVVTRHEIDYRRPLLFGQTVLARTWVGDAPRGARFLRHMEFVDDAGVTYVSAQTLWAMVDRASSRPMRVPPDLVRAFAAPVKPKPL